MQESGSDILAERIKDFGPIYAETNVSNLIIEPLNTLSNLIFLLIIIFWARKTKLQLRKYPLIVCCLPILTIGFLGGSIFHATRSHNIWLLMDFIPIGVLALTVALRLWYLLTQSLIYTSLAPLTVITIPRYLAQVLGAPLHLKISFGYVGLALAILLPAFLLSLKNKKIGLKELVLSTSFICIGIFFRASDLWFGNYIPFGTHFLWHLFGGLSVHCLIWYLFKIRLVK